MLNFLYILVLHATNVILCLVLIPLPLVLIILSFHSSATPHKDIHSWQVSVFMTSNIPSLY